ncbi:hypothetical protein ABW20_dc0100092 [Dactylellina cionopaga]|nr:hypothetical protein ABW20_dc0100092 [Dactylellina cionopaga]
MGLFKKKTRLDIRIRRSILRALIPTSKSSAEDFPAVADNDNSDTRKNEKTPKVNETVVYAATPSADTAVESLILLLPAELLRDIFSYLDTFEIQSLYDTHPRFRGIVVEHRSFLCKELAARNLRYFARYLKPEYFDLQRESRARFLPISDSDSGVAIQSSNSPGQNGIPAWYLSLCKLDQVAKELYSLMPADENEWETEYLRIQGLPPSQYNPRVWPRPGNPSFYFTHTIISFYQYNSLIKLPRDSLVEFKARDIRAVCRCAQGYFRSTAHLGILCAVYMACLKFNTERNGEEAGGEDPHGILVPFLPELGGGLGNYIKGSRVSVKELFKMVVVVMHPANLLKVIREPTVENMGKLKVVLETLKEVLVRNEEERRRSGVDRTYTKGLEMMEGFATYWESMESEEDRKRLQYFDDWELMA